LEVLTMQIITDRRSLHRIPELELQLPKTMEYLTGALKNLRCRIFSPMESSLCAFFDFGADDAIAFRADCDALPIFEKTGAEYASTHDGAMHACGHDGHMAILLELARRLNEKDSLPHNVLLIFQPAEETIDGAKWICRAGVLEQHNVKAIFGLHIWPELEAGKVFSRANELMARSCEISIDIVGRSSHIAKPSEGLDALAAGASLYTRARELERSFPDEIHRILNFGFMTSGTVRNAISSHTKMKGSLRAFQDEIFLALRNGLLDIGRQVEAESGCRVDIHINEGYPALINPPALYDRVQKAAPFAPLDAPTMTAEDFSYYQHHLDAIFFFLGLGNVPALHSDNFHFDETILLKGADFFEKLAENFQ
jgi:hippurate hydrolase